LANSHEEGINKYSAMKSTTRKLVYAKLA